MVGGSQEKMSFFSNSLWTNSEYPNLLKNQSQHFFGIVTGLVTQLASLANDPLLASLLRISMYLSRVLVV